MRPVCRNFVTLQTKKELYSKENINKSLEIGLVNENYDMLQTLKNDSNETFNSIMKTGKFHLYKSQLDTVNTNIDDYIRAKRSREK